MFSKRILCLLLSLILAGGLGITALAAEVSCDATYCFCADEFSTSEEDPLAGICITGLPDAETGTVMLGQRVLQAGDILTADQVAQMTFHPLRRESDSTAAVTYLPIYEDRVETCATVTLSIKGKTDQAPVAEDSAIETYKNLPNTGKLKASDPEGETLTYTLVRGPKRGTVVLNEDGSFLYTPKKNKVGVDSFTYTATDPAGKVSREATVTVQILKPTDAKQYADTVGLDCRFEAEWMRNTGLFTGAHISGQLCFQPEETVSRGEFLAMTVQLLDIPTDSFDYTCIPADTPHWLKPYLAAAIRSGLTDGCPDLETFNGPITGAEAAVMLQNALDLTVSDGVLEQVASMDSEAVPTWALSSVTALAANGVTVDAPESLTRADLAEILYTVNQLSLTAPGTAVFRLQE